MPDFATTDLVGFRELTPNDVSEAAAFLTDFEWPFHGVRRLDNDAAVSVVTQPGDGSRRVFWIIAGGSPVGLVRLLDLDDLHDGCPMFDLRVAPTARGRGVGRATVRWLTEFLFSQHPKLQRIEATTRFDNLAMQRVFDRCGYQREGQLRRSWRSDDGQIHDTLVYGILRDDPR